MVREPLAATVPRRERLAVASCLAILALLAWLYLAAVADAMDAMGGSSRSAFMALMPMGPWGPGEFALGFAMWAVMMVAMMLPGTGPMLLGFHAMARRRFAARTAAARLAAFVLGYVAVWAGFSAGATALQGWLHAADAVTDLMISSNRTLDAALLLGAGAWQLSPVKQVCLAKCRSPLAFFMSEWREGGTGAFVMGLRHGAFCVGCCWALMALLFVAGIMNLLWIALLSAAVRWEKVLPSGVVAARAAGVVLCAGGLWLLLIG
jgi:predicted metal-binding membrane protein